MWGIFPNEHELLDVTFTLPFNYYKTKESDVQTIKALFFKTNLKSSQFKRDFKDWWV